MHSTGRDQRWRCACVNEQTTCRTGAGSVWGRAMAKEMKTRKEFADLVMREAAPAASAQIFRACMSRDQSSADAPTGILGPGQTLLISYRVLAE